MTPRCAKQQGNSPGYLAEHQTWQIVLEVQSAQPENRAGLHCVFPALNNFCFSILLDSTWWDLPEVSTKTRVPGYQSRETRSIGQPKNQGPPDESSSRRYSVGYTERSFTINPMTIVGGVLMWTQQTSP